MWTPVQGLMPTSQVATQPSKQQCHHHTTWRTAPSAQREGLMNLACCWTSCVNTHTHTQTQTHAELHSGSRQCR